MSSNPPLNSYQVQESVHRSRRFSIYRATKTDGGKEVLIKTPDPMRVKDADLIATLISEAEACTKLSHPNIREGYECVNEGSGAFFIGEYITGMPLARYLTLERDKISHTIVLNWAKDLLEALDYAHNMGLVHLNLNPHNIIVCPDQRLKIIGFGKDKSAWMYGEQEDYAYHPILFVAPELFQAGIGLAASDLYSFAVLIYLCYCKLMPWRIDYSLGSVQQKKQSLCRAVIMPEILNVSMPDWLYTAILSCLKLDPHQRIGSAKELLDIFEQEGSAQAASEIIDEKPAEEPLAEAKAIAEVPEPESITETFPIADVPKPEVIPDSIPVSEPVPEPEIDAVPKSTVCTEPEIPEPALELTEPVLPFTELIDKPEPRQAITEQIIDEPEASLVMAYLSDTMPASDSEISLPTQSDPEPISPIKEELPPPAPKPIPPKPNQTRPMYSPTPYRTTPKQDTLDNGSLMKTFKVLLWLSLVVLVFIVFKYFVFANRPKFNLKEDSLDVAIVENIPANANTPINMVLVPADTLVMGSIASDADDDEFPLLTIKLAPFYISSHEITQAEWLMIFPSNPSQNEDKNYPVENVSFYDVIEFCNEKSIKDGYRPCYDYQDTEVICNFDADGYRLPTEAEWEFAAKAAKQRDFFVYSGSNQPDDIGWHSGNSNAKSHPGGKKDANKLGLYDLSGNLYEWVWNWYAPYSYKVGDLYKGPENGTDKVIRGGSWYHAPSEMRVSNRDYAKPFTKSPFIGFRVVRSVSTM